MNNICPICAFSELAYDEDGNAAVEICRQCEFQFVNDDSPDKNKTIEAWRKKWQQAGKTPFYFCKE